MKSLLSLLFNSRGRFGAPGWKLSRGQSLVELGLTMPILLLIMAGTVEVTNIITVYNQLQLGVREGARLAAQGAPDPSVIGVINDSLKGTAVNFTPAPDKLSVWVVRPTLDVYPQNCTSGCNWRWKNGTGGNQTTWGEASQQCITTDSTGERCSPLGPPVQADIVGGQIWAVAQNQSFHKERFAIVSARYNIPLFLNLNLFRTADGTFPVSAYTVYRQEVTSQAASQLAGGCSAYPLIINHDRILGKAPGDSISSIPLNTGSDKSGFAFVAWTFGMRTEPGLVNASPGGSLPRPGNSQRLVPSTNTTNYYRSPINGTEQMRRGSWVYANPTGLTANVRTQLNLHADVNGPGVVPTEPPRAIRILVFDEGVAVATPESIAAGLTISTTENPQNITLPVVGTQLFYQISGFLVVYVEDNPAPTATAVSFIYVKEDSSCGFAQQ